MAARLLLIRELELADATSKSDLMDYEGRITIDPEQCGGQPCIRHYRIRVKDVLEMLAQGANEQEILHDFHSLSGKTFWLALDSPLIPTAVALD